jgi:iron complex outermembrane recepter protein
LSTLSKQNPIAKAVKLALFATAAVSVTSATSIFAAEAEEGEEAQKDRQVITITGSRIKSANLTSVSPLQILNSEDIIASGATNLQELLLENPTFGSPGISRTNSNFSTASAGVSLVDLRDLGSDRTLVLVNGRRMVAGVPGSAAVDLNTIPTQFIERVEILTGGASSVYGSDAVAGVVNLVLKDDLQGSTFDVQYGESKEGDNETKRVSFTTGIDSADGKGNMMFHLSYSDQGAVFSKDREPSAVDQAAGINPDGSFNITRPFFSSFPPQGRFTTGGTTYTYDPNGNLQAGFSTNGNGTIGPNGFNRSAFRTIAIPTERYLLAANGTYDINDRHTAFFEGSYANSQTKTQLEPFPFASNDIYSGTGGIVPIEFMVNGTMLRNPFVPDAIYNASIDLDGDGSRDLAGFAKRLLDIANRGNVADRDTFRFVVGVEGELSDDWYYDVFYTRGQTKESQVSSGQVNVLNFRYALESVVDTFDLDGDGLTNDAVCVDATARAFGCVPINIYGFNSITPEMAQYVNAPGMLASFISQEVVGGNISGEVFELPAGPIGIATGFEIREEFSRDEFDPLQQAGLNAGNAIPATRGEFDVREAFLEANVPVFEGFDIRAAYRASDYSTVGNTASWNFGINYQINDTFRLRAIQAESTRAPNIGELFSPPSQTFPSCLTDPCVGVTASSSAPGDDVCRADPGVAANIALNGAYTSNPQDFQGVSGFNRGNPNASEEVGKSTTFGLIITPTDIAVLEDFSFTLDYYEIEIEDALVSTPRQFILEQCYDGGDTSFCDFITRRPTAVGFNAAGSLEFVDSAVSNSGGLTVEGVDLTVKYSTDIGVGKFTGQLAYAHLLEGFTIPLPGADTDFFVGEVDTPQDKVNLILGYKWDNFDVTLAVNYQSAVDLDDQVVAPGTVTIPSATYVDMQASYAINQTYEVYIGIDNMLDEDPPLIPSGIPGNNTGVETGSTYDPIGQRWYVGGRINF